MTSSASRYTPLNAQPPTLQVDDFDVIDVAYDPAPDNNQQQQQPAPADHGLANRTPFLASSSTSSTELNSLRTDRPSTRALLFPVAANHSAPSVCSTASATPVPSRTASPLYVQDDCASSCSSDSEESELESTLLRETHRRRYSYSDGTPRWWTSGPTRRRRRTLRWLGAARWGFRRFVLPFIPKTPLTIVRATIELWPAMLIIPCRDLRYSPYCSSLLLVSL